MQSQEILLIAAIVAFVAGCVYIWVTVPQRQKRNTVSGEAGGGEVPAGSSRQKHDLDKDSGDFDGGGDGGGGGGD